MLIETRFFRLYPNLLLILVVLCDCSVSKPKINPIEVWPKPPEFPRYIYETSIKSIADITEPAGKFETILAQSKGLSPRAFLKPFGIAARNGIVLVSDTAAGVVHVFNIPHRSLYRLGKGKKATLQKPVGITIDHKKNIYVTDIIQKKIFVYDSVGHFRHTIGDELFLEKPVDVAVNKEGNRIYIVDAGGVGSNQHRIVVYDENGKLIFTFGTRGTKSGQFNLPVQIEIGTDNSLYVLDAGNFRIQVFNQYGSYLRSWGGIGRNYGSLARPRGLALDLDNNVYVADAAFRNVQVFTADGQLLMWIGEPGKKDLPGKFALPAGIAIDETTRIYVVDQMFRKVDVFRRLSHSESEELVSNRAIPK